MQAHVGSPGVLLGLAAAAHASLGEEGLPVRQEGCEALQQHRVPSQNVCGLHSRHSHTPTHQGARRCQGTLTWQAGALARTDE